MFEKYPDILTPMQVCKALSLGRNSVYNLIHSGQLKSITIGRRILVPKLFLIDFIDSYRKTK